MTFEILFGKRTLILYLFLYLAISINTNVAFAAPPTYDNQGHEIAARAFVICQSSDNTDYEWGGESWYPWYDTDPSRTYGIGTDCSGLVLKCWQVPDTLYYPWENPPNTFTRYTTGDFTSQNYHWSQVSSASRGDAYTKTGHMWLYEKNSGVASTPWAWEAYNSTRGVRHWIRPDSDIATYIIKRRNNLESLSGTIRLDNPTAAYWNDSYGWVNYWNSGTGKSGYTGSNYQQSHGPSQTTKVAAKWVPEIKTKGYYLVWVKWAPASDNASNAKYEIKYRGGTLVRYRNQTDMNYVNTWSQLTTSGSVPFDVGYSTANTYMNLVARDPGAGYTADGYVIADAVKFVWDRAADW